MRKLIAPAALIAGLVLSTGALAAPMSSSPAAMTSAPVIQVTPAPPDLTSILEGPAERVSASETVSYGDLNLANRADVKTLDRRVAAAARQDCRAIRSAYPVELYPTVSGGGDCERAAERDALAAVAPAVRAASALGGD